MTSEQSGRLTPSLVENPRESLALELKGWIDPDKPEGIATIAKACIALRNNDGGHLLIGFDDRTCKPLASSHPTSTLTTTYHADKIQGIVSRYSSEKFEVLVHFESRDGLNYPVIHVPAGVKTPVASRRELKNQKKRLLVKSNQIYVRSLEANGTVSTSEAQWKDWERLLDICFDNREADIGRFIRRHLVGLTEGHIVKAIEELRNIPITPQTPSQLLPQLLNDGQARFDDIAGNHTDLPAHGSMEVAALVEGEIPDCKANLEFLRKLMSSHPNYSGWPFWIDTRNASDTAHRPYVHEDGWETFVFWPSPSWGVAIDFWRIEPSARFYHRRALEDDSSQIESAPEPLTKLDFGLVVLRATEAIATALELAKGSGISPDGSQIHFAFRWKGLKGRELDSWANPGRIISPGRIGYKDEVVSQASVPLNIAKTAIGDSVRTIVTPVLEVFDDFVLSPTVLESLVNSVLSRSD